MGHSTITSDSADIDHPTDWRRRWRWLYGGTAVRWLCSGTAAWLNSGSGGERREMEMETEQSGV